MLLFKTYTLEFGFNRHVEHIVSYEGMQNLQFLMTEIFKTINNENPPFMKEIFVREESVYNLRCMFRLKVPRVSTTKNGLETISFRGSQIWNSLPKNLKELNSVTAFKRAIKGWNGENCNCRICSVK